MEYVPTRTDLDPGILEELESISEAFNHLKNGYMLVRHVPPTRPRVGQLVVADGTDWDPLSTGVLQLALCTVVGDPATWIAP